MNRIYRTMEFVLIRSITTRFHGGVFRNAGSTRCMIWSGIAAVVTNRWDSITMFQSLGGNMRMTGIWCDCMDSGDGEGVKLIEGEGVGVLQKFWVQSRILLMARPCA